MDELKKKLPEIDVLDAEFEKNFETIYDIFLSTMNKYIQVINVLRDDLEVYTRNALRKHKWNIDKDAYINTDVFPRKQKAMVSEFTGDLWFSVGYDIYKKNKDLKKGYSVSIDFDGKVLTFGFGNWDEIFDKDWYFPLEFFEKIKNNFLKTQESKNITINIFFPDTDNEDNNGKYICYDISCSHINSTEKLLEQYKLFKKYFLDKAIEYVIKEKI